MRRVSDRSRWQLIGGVIFGVIALAVLILSFTDLGKRLWVPQSYDPELRAALSKPLRLEVFQPGKFEEVLLSLRTFHYRAQPRSVAVYSDFFYDTPDWKLYRNGYSYRFRQKRGDDGNVNYSLRLEREPRFVDEGTKKIDLREQLPADLGQKVVQGGWGLLVRENEKSKVMQLLSFVLEELDISPQNLRPRLMAELRRKRFDITDKGRNWFELDHEVWSFRAIAESHSEMQFEDVVIDTQLKKRDPELIRRVITVKRLAHMIHGARVIDRAPHERAIERLRVATEG